MKCISALAILGLVVGSPALHGAQDQGQVRQMEAAGDAAAARAALSQAAETQPTSVAALTAYAEFLDQYGDPGCREAYTRLLAVLVRSGNKARAATVAQRLTVLDLLADDRTAAARDAAAYRTASGKSFALPVELPATAPSAAPGITAAIPGPFRSFARMAAISPDAAPDEILPALARNVVTNGYQASHSNEALEQTEYLKLVHRYLSQARELEKLAGDGGIIQIENCDSPVVAELLRTLGFRMRGGCGAEVVLETVNAARAFLTTDSGFPLNKLEQALRTNHPFSYDFHATAVPVMFGTQFWSGGAKDKDAGDFLEALISDPAQCRLYLGLAKLDPATADGLRAAIPYSRLKAFAHVLDFFGSMFVIRDGKAVVPGGARSAAVWGELTGASPDKGTDFFDKLLAKDDGWLASLYDAIARIRGPVQDYLTDPIRMKRFYTAVRGRITSPGPARPVFRANTDMMLFTTRLQVDPNGKPHIPGNLEVWKTLFTNHPQGKYDGKLTRLATSWKEPDDVLEALFALCRKTVENEPLKIFMAISDLDRGRPAPLEPATVDKLARAYHDFGAQFPLFAESHSLSDHAMVQFLEIAENIAHMHDMAFKADVAGTLQSITSLWQILVRQQTIPEAQADAAFVAVIAPFAQLHSNRELFDAGRAGIQKLMAARTGPASAVTQAGLVGMLSGPETANAETREEMIQGMMRILEAQRAIPLETLLDFADNLESVSKGSKLNATLVAKLASRINDIPLPRAPLTSNEVNAMGYGYWTDRHVDSQRKLNLRLAVERAAGDGEKLKDIRGQLAPLLRDSLLAFSYAYYAPPGAQILYTNPLFVRSHDFLGMAASPTTWRTTEVYGTGWPSNGGGRLVGSLATLPYGLAEAEQNFLIPVHTQALIWGDLVPQIILSAKTPRWWNVTPLQLHWVGLHLRYGRELFGEAAFDETLRGQVADAFAQAAAPVRASAVRELLAQGMVAEAVNRATPSELFQVARELAPGRAGGSSSLLAEIRRLAESAPAEANYAAVSRAFGTPKPTLANSYQPELLNLRTFPTLMGYSSRIMAESWESNNLYWAALADELSVPPAELNVRIPEWTQRLVEAIFASHLEDWPALLKSLRQVGDDVRAHARAAAASEMKTGLQELPNR